MITVYRYGFEAPKPPEPPQTPVAAYLLLAAAGWWVWRKWFAAGRVVNPRVRARSGGYVSIPWFGRRTRVKLVRIEGGGRAVVRFPGGNLHNVPTAHMRKVK